MNNLTIKKVKANSIEGDWISKSFNNYLDELSNFSGLNNYKKNSNGNWEPDFRECNFDPKTKSLYLFIKKDEKIGFSIISHNLDKASRDQWEHEIAEFYVIPAFRRKKSGYNAANQLFKENSGKWKVSLLGDNIPAIEFWESTLNKKIGFVKESIDNGKYLSFLFNEE